MVQGVLVLLDALGSKTLPNENLENKVRKFDLVDESIKKCISTLRDNLGRYNYDNLIISGAIYDNFQVFLPFRNKNSAHVDMTGKNNCYYNLISMGNLVIQILRLSLSHNIPLRGCIASGYGEITNNNRVLGPVADEAAYFYEMADWIGVIATNHAGIVLNNNNSLSSNRGWFEPYVKYLVPIKESIYDHSLDAYKIRYTKRDFWALRWPIQQGYERTESEKFIVVTPSNRTEYGDIISNDTLLALINTSVKHKDKSMSRKWKNTKDFFDYVIGNQ